MTSTDALQSGAGTAVGSASPALSFRNVSMVFPDGTHAVDNVSFDVQPGEFVTVVGPSGCGKSTLLRLVAGLHLPSTGEVRVDGRIVDRPQTNLGIVFQSPVLLDWRNALDNVLVQVELRGLDPRAYRDRAKKLLEQVGLKDFADRHPHELSGGMRQRVSIARALIHDAPLLLMDEPFGALDEMTRERLNRELLNVWAETGTTLIFVTHSIAEAVFLSDRIVVMSPRPGRVLEILESALPRPRRMDMMATPEFGAMTAHLRARFNVAGAVE